MVGICDPVGVVELTELLWIGSGLRIFGRGLGRTTRSLVTACVPTLVLSTPLDEDSPYV